MGLAYNPEAVGGSRTPSISVLVEHAAANLSLIRGPASGFNPASERSSLARLACRRSFQADEEIPVAGIYAD